MDLPKNKTALAAGVAETAVVMIAVLAIAVWPALTRPDPPAEAMGDDGLRIRLVEPPKASSARSSPLNVGPSEAAQARAKGDEALFAGTSAFRPAPVPARHVPAEIAQVDNDEDDLASPPEQVDDQEERERVESGYEPRPWEDQRQARREQDRRAAWEQAQRDGQRWEEGREQDRYDDRGLDDPYASPSLADDDHPPPGW